MDIKIEIKEEPLCPEQSLVEWKFGQKQSLFSNFQLMKEEKLDFASTTDKIITEKVPMDRVSLSHMQKFTQKDKDTLAEICKKYPVVKDKKYCVDTIKRKRESWETITREFNAATPGRPRRDVLQLRGLWKRMKLLAKKESEGTKEEHAKAVGSPSINQGTSMVTEFLDVYCNPLELTNDDSGMQLQEGEAIEFDIPVVQEVTSAVSSTSQTSQHLEDWKKKSKRETGDAQEVILRYAALEHAKKMELLEVKLEAAKEKCEANKIKKEFYRRKLDLLKDS